MNEITVYCPICGKPMAADVEVHEVRKFTAYLQVEFRNANPQHKCTPDPTRDRVRDE